MGQPGSRWSRGRLEKREGGSSGVAEGAMGGSAARRGWMEGGEGVWGTGSTEGLKGRSRGSRGGLGWEAAPEGAVVGGLGGPGGMRPAPSRLPPTSLGFPRAGPGLAFLWGEALSILPRFAVQHLSSEQVVMALRRRKRKRILFSESV